MENIKIFSCNSAENFTKNVCDYLGIKMGEIDSFKFANDNNFVQLKESVRGDDVYIIQTTKPPVNERIMELLITVEAAKRAGAKEIYAGATHGILVGPAIERIKKSPIKELVVTSTVPIEDEKMIDKIKIVSIEPLFAEAIKRLHEGTPLGDLFEYDK